ncbi:hypothetical protein D6850_03945 [Roseovarius spongiae]|uniref:Nickel/cobalt efflux system n=1 Tax=Roseovarius spongiae TaxID=2320272 RepID=A0A3A8AYW0_9RHOB|nr:hypothetical protein [Roseovarius spongiae]RKF16699.1 hypothetical protein D6850_03945 [Roseovarius spongiae]
MQLKAYRLFAVVLAVGVGLWLVLPWDQLLRWAASEQREFQNAMARALRAVRAGEPAALLTLCAATAGYGVVHAIGPGHGKVLIGGAALASGSTFQRLAGLTVLSSLAQAGTAIVLVGLLVFALRFNARDAAELTETWLAPLSAIAIALIGLVLVLRGVRALHKRSGAATDDTAQDQHKGACGCGHAHAPTVEEVRSLNSMREALAIVASIAIRPCTGALFVLVIAARFDAFGAGVLAVLAMALGTAATILTVAAGGRLARLFVVMGQSTKSVQALNLSAMLHILGGGLILGLSMLFLAPYLT